MSVGVASGRGRLYRRHFRSWLLASVYITASATFGSETAAQTAPEPGAGPQQLPQVTVQAPTPTPRRPSAPARVPAFARPRPKPSLPSPRNRPNRPPVHRPFLQLRRHRKQRARLTVKLQQEIAARPITRPGEVLESVPGLIITQHSGEGKANQYFLRGYNLDHGTDLAIFIDDMPINMRTHAHGQGYADLNFLIPELVATMNIRKGPYYADAGDFSSVGDVRINLFDSLEKQVAQYTFGSFGYQRFLAMGSTPLANGTLLYAGEAGAYNGPWTSPDDMRKLNGVLRYSQGTPDNGFSVTGMAYSNRWNSTDQVPLRAIASGELGLYDALDPSDGGNSNRFSFSGRWAQTDDSGAWRANVYLVRSTLDLFNNFTYFLSDPNNGDQFHQHDDRLLTGANAARTFNWTAGSLRQETTFGVQSRYDDVTLGLTNTFQRQFLSNIRTDLVREGSVGIYGQNVSHWTDWFRTVVGWRGDLYTASDASIFDPANSGNPNAGISSPKFSMVFGPFARTELFVSGGYGFHSNDVRGVTITEEPGDPTQKLNASPFLVRTKGEEVGIRTKFLPGLDSSVSLFRLDQASELVFSGDAGDTEASRPSRRVGVEFTNSYRPLSLARLRCRSRGHARPVHRVRSGPGRPVRVARRLSAGPDRQRPRQLRSRRAESRGIRRDHARRKDRLVRRVALPLSRPAAAHRGRCLPIASDRLGQRSTRLPLHKRMAHSARCVQPHQQQDRSDQLCLRFAAEIG